MTSITSVRWWAVVTLAVGSVLAWGNPPQQQKQNPKELMKEAQTDEEHENWESALKKLQTAASLRHKDKAIAQALKQAQEHLADLTATRAMASCNELKIDTCEQQVKLALSYARTQRAGEAESQLAARKAELQKRWDQAQQMIDSSQLEPANAVLESLSPFPYLFPTLSAEKERLRRLRLNADLAQGNKDIAGNQFDEAQQAFSAALRLDAGNAEAVRGIDAAAKGKEAFHCYQEAKDAFGAKNYEVAYLSNQKALVSFPERQEYQDFDKQVSSEWLKVLEDPRGLSPNPENLKDNQTAWESVEWIRRLDPHYQGLAETSRKIGQNLYSNYISKANEYQSLPNNSGIGTAYLYAVNAQRKNPEPKGEDPFAASLREVSALFARKRSMLVLVSVENLSPVPPGFSEVVTRRMRATIEGLSLPDLKVSSLDAYEKNPPEDPLFQDYRPDGKSPIVLVALNIMNHEGETTGNDTPEEKPSKFTSGQETLPNPDYEKTLEQYRTVNDALSRKHKEGKPTKEGYTTSDLTILQQKLTQTPPTLTRDKITDYTYQEYHLSSTAHIAMKLEIRDMLEKHLLASDEVESTRQDKATEVAGVQGRDVNGLIDRQPRLKTPEQLLQEAQLDVLKALDQKVPALLDKYVQRYYKEGEKALGEGRTSDAVENFLCYWYTFRAQMDDKRSQHMREVVKLYTGFDLNAPESLVASQ